VIVSENVGRGVEALQYTSQQDAVKLKLLRTTSFLM
jgi:hypothetical protein